MASSAGISGIGVATATAGALLMYAGIRDVAILDALREVTGGTLPKGNAESEGQVSASVAAAQAVMAGSAGGAASAVPAVAGGGTSRLAQAALRYLGVRYKWGGTTSAGLDCSGLVQLSFSDIGIKAPRTTYQQQPWKALHTISADQAAAGDLVFWPGHVAILVSPGTVVHAPHPGTVVRTESVANAGPRGQRATYKRYGGSGATSPGPAAPPKSMAV